VNPESPPFDAATLQAVQEVSWHLLALAEQFNANFATHAARAGLPVGAAKLMLQLGPEEAVPMRTLAERAHSDPSNLTSLVDKLEAKGILERRADDVDRRVKILVLTPKGKQTRESLWHQITHDVGPLAHLTPAQVNELRDALREAVKGIRG
jgi:DNA-binding MarR family transcriptional regulator